MQGGFKFIEVEHTHYDKAKRDLYKAAGVAEMWELATPQSGRPSVILDLRRSVDPQPLFSSNLLPGVVAGRLNEALLLLERLGGHDEILERGANGGGALNRQLLKAAGVRMDRPGCMGGP